MVKYSRIINKKKFVISGKFLYKYDAVKMKEKILKKGTHYVRIIEAIKYFEPYNWVILTRSKK